jgi:hypothetical protein
LRLQARHAIFSNPRRQSLVKAILRDSMKNLAINRLRDFLSILTEDLAGKYTCWPKCLSVDFVRLLFREGLSRSGRKWRFLG